MEKNINIIKRENAPSLLSRNKEFIIGVILVLILGLISLGTGEYDIRSSKDGMDMFLITRVPRTISLMLTGMAMALGGLVMQLITQNRLVEPTTTGTIEWAGLGLIVSYMVFKVPTLFERMTFSIVFSFLGTFLFFVLLRNLKLKSSIIVPIVGMMIGAIVSAISSFLSLYFNLSQTLEGWFVGSFSSVQIGRYEYLYLIIIITVLIFILSDRLTVVGLGKDFSLNLGVNYNLMIIIATGLLSLSTGIVASVIGNLPFLGLIVPNLVSLYRGDDLRSNLPFVCLGGMGIIMICDILSRIVISPFELPVSLILGTLGSFVFLVLLLKRKIK